MKKFLLLLLLIPLFGHGQTGTQTYFTPGIPPGSVSFTLAARFKAMLTDSLNNIYLSNGNKYYQVYTAAQANALFAPIGSGTVTTTNGIQLFGSNNVGLGGSPLTTNTTINTTSNYELFLGDEDKNTATIDILPNTSGGEVDLRSSDAGGNNTTKLFLQTDRGSLTYQGNNGTDNIAQISPDGFLIDVNDSTGTKQKIVSVPANGNGIEVFDQTNIGLIDSLHHTIISGLQYAEIIDVDSMINAKIDSAFAVGYTASGGVGLSGNNFQLGSGTLSGNISWSTSGSFGIQSSGFTSAAILGIGNSGTQLGSTNGVQQFLVSSNAINGTNSSGSFIGYETGITKLTGLQINVDSAKFIDQVHNAPVYYANHPNFTGHNTNIPDVITVDSLTNASKNYVNIVDFGADTSGTVAIHAAYRSAVAYAIAHSINRIYFPQGHFAVDSCMVLPNGMNIFGDGSNKTFLTASSTNIGNYITPDTVTNPNDGQIHAVIYSGGSHTYLTNIHSVVHKTDVYIKAITGLGLKIGDQIQLQDTTSFSFSKFRAYYKEGEYFTVQKYSNDTIYVDHPISGNYATLTSAQIFKVNATQNNITGISLTNQPVSNLVGIMSEYGINSHLQDVIALNGARSNIEFRYGYNVSVHNGQNIQSASTISGLPATQYGVVFEHCQNFTVNGGIYYAYQHAIVTVGNSVGSNIVNRFGDISNVTANSLNPNHAGINFHGNSQYYKIHDNNISAVSWGGEFGDVINNNILGMQGTTSYLLNILEAKRLLFNVLNNNIEFNTQNIGASSRWFSATIDTTTQTGGRLVLKGNNVHIINPNNLSISTIADIELLNAKTNYNVKMVIDNNPILGNDKGVSSRFQIKGLSGFTLGSLELSNNHWQHVYIEKTFLDTVTEHDNIFENVDGLPSYTSQTPIVRIYNNHYPNFCIGTTPPANTYQKGAFSVRNANKVWVNNNTGSSAGVNATQSYYIQTVDTLYQGNSAFTSLQPVLSSVMKTLFYDFPGIHLPSFTPSTIATVDANGNLSSTTETYVYQLPGATNDWNTAIDRTMYVDATTNAPTGANYMGWNIARSGNAGYNFQEAGRNNRFFDRTEEAGVFGQWNERAYLNKAQTISALWTFSTGPSLGAATATTAASGTNTTQVATTAFVKSAGAIHGNSTTTGTATTAVTVTIGQTMANTTYAVTIAPQDLLTAVNWYISAKTTTTFTVTFVTALTGSISFDWVISP